MEFVVISRTLNANGSTDTDSVTIPRDGLLMWCDVCYSGAISGGGVAAYLITLDVSFNGPASVNFDGENRNFLSLKSGVDVATANPNLLIQNSKFCGPLYIPVPRLGTLGVRFGSSTNLSSVCQVHFGIQLS